MQIQLKPWGNSRGFRIPKELLNITGFTSEDVLQLEASHGQIIIKKKFTHRTLAERAEAFGGQLNLLEEIEWDEPVGSEVW